MRFASIMITSFAVFLMSHIVPVQGIGISSIKCRFKLALFHWRSQSISDQINKAIDEGDWQRAYGLFRIHAVLKVRGEILKQREIHWSKFVQLVRAIPSTGEDGKKDLSDLPLRTHALIDLERFLLTNQIHPKSDEELLQPNFDIQDLKRILHEKRAAGMPKSIVGEVEGGIDEIFREYWRTKEDYLRELEEALRLCELMPLYQMKIGIFATQKLTKNFPILASAVRETSRNLRDLQETRAHWKKIQQAMASFRGNYVRSTRMDTVLQTKAILWQYLPQVQLTLTNLSNAVRYEAENLGQDPAPVLESFKHFSETKTEELEKKLIESVQSLDPRELRRSEALLNYNMDLHTIERKYQLSLMQLAATPAVKALVEQRLQFEGQEFSRDRDPPSSDRPQIHE